jgi:type I restriction enzyme S subunit
MNTDSFYRQVVSNLGATTSPHVNVGDIKNRLIPNASYEEQKLIGKALKSQDTLILEEEKRQSKLIRMKQGLMHDLLTGKAPVKVDQQETAHP